MRSHKNRAIAAAIAGLVLGTVSAEVPAGTTAEEIARINEQIAVLAAQKQKLQLEVDIASKQAEITKLAGMGAPVNTDRGVTPVVRSIEGADGKFYATLAFGNGVQQTVKVGEKIHGDWTIAQIDVSSVTLTRGRERIKLPFGNEPPPAQGNSAGQSLPGPGFGR